jgi:hypothetical protein
MAAIIAIALRALVVRHLRMTVRIKVVSDTDITQKGRCVPSSADRSSWQRRKGAGSVKLT